MNVATVITATPDVAQAYAAVFLDLGVKADATARRIAAQVELAAASPIAAAAESQLSKDTLALYGALYAQTGVTPGLPPAAAPAAPVP